MLINGEEKALACPTVLSELLTQLGYRAAFVSIELNGNIIKQADFGSTTITDADKLEIVSFVGGGCKPYPLSRTFLREREKQQFLPEPLLLSFY